MKPSAIVVGHTYRNRGRGTTARTVTGIGVEFRPKRKHSSTGACPDDMPGVQYTQKSKSWFSPDIVTRRLWLDSFASWAGADITEEVKGL